MLRWGFEEMDAGEVGLGSMRRVGVRLVLGMLVSLCALSGGLLFASTPAFAVHSHVFERSFGSGPCEVKLPLEPCEGRFNGPAGVAIREGEGPQKGDVYVVDAGNNRVEYFSSAGAYIGQFNGSGSNLPVEGKAAPTGQFLFPETTYPAIVVDNSCQLHKPEPLAGAACEAFDPSFGDVYVADVGHEVIDKFSPTGRYIGQVTGTCENAGENPAAVCPGSTNKEVIRFGEIKGIAIDTNGLLWVYQRNLAISSFSAAEENVFLSSRNNPLAGGNALIGFAVDSGDTLYLNEAGGGSPKVTKLDSLGNVLVEGFYNFPNGSSDRTIAVDLSTDEVYVNGADSEGAVARLTATGSVIEKFGSGQLASAVGGIAVNSKTQEVLVADFTANKVDVFALEQLSPPAVDSESVSQVSATSARLETELNPHGLPTRYRFEYGLSAAYGESVPVPEGDAGSAFGDSAFSLLVEGLTSGATYHYRVVATNELGTVTGPDKSFVTQGGETQGVLDGRAWELVSPPDKHGVSLEALTGEGGAIQAAEDGGGLAYIAKAPIDTEPAGNRSIADTELLATRTGPGVWSTKDIATAHEDVTGLRTGELSEYKLFSSDLSVGLLEPSGSTPLTTQSSEPRASERTPYRREADGSYVPLVHPGNVPAGTKFGGKLNGSAGEVNDVKLITGTPDARHVILRSTVALTPGLVSGTNHNLFEWSGGTLQLVSILPDNTTADADLGQPGGSENERVVRNAVSSDGTRVFFAAGGALFVRDVVRGETVQVDAPEAGASGSPGGGRFQLANRDGSRVFFTDLERLTIDSTALSPGKSDLYMCEVKIVLGKLSCKLKDLTVDQNPGEAAEVLGSVIGADDVGRYVYFAANGALAAGAVHGKCGTQESHSLVTSRLCNLYVRDTVSETTRLVAVVSEADEPDWANAEGGSGADLGALTGRVSGSGRWFAFMSSRRPASGFDNRDVGSGVGAQEVFLFDRLSGGPPVCVSCASSGARPVAQFDLGVFPGLLVDRPLLWGGQWLAGSIPGWTRVARGGALYQSRFLSDEGRLFFNSPVGLVSGDANGKQDVYEYEPAGVGGCGVVSGCVGLVSSGASSEESAFLDASVSGNDVFFMTAARLTGLDTDSAFDVYDAHVCSAGSPCPSGVVGVPPACSTADSCRVAPAPQPGIFGAPASATFSGVGNVEAPAKTAVKTVVRCKKGKRLSRGKCVKRHKRVGHSKRVGHGHKRRAKR